MKDKPIKGLKKRPLYDPTIEQLNDKARLAASKRQQESRFQKTTTHKAQKPEGRLVGLEQHGKRIAQMGQKYLGTIAVHIYEESFNLVPTNVNINLTSLKKVPSQLAIKALQDLTLHTMNQYNVKAPRTLDKKKQAERTILEDDR